jgi:hypothetical protein
MHLDSRVGSLALRVNTGLGLTLSVEELSYLFVADLS